MALGDFISNLPVMGVINAGATIYDLMESTRARNELGAQYDVLNQLLQSSLARDATFYNDVAARAGSLEQILAQAMQTMGGRNVIGQGAIDQRRAALESQYLEDADRAAMLEASKGFANMRERGLDNSTLADDLAAIRARNAGDARMTARNKAYTDAITQLTGQENLINANRGNILNEYTGVAGAPINLMRTANGNNITYGLNSAVNNAGNQLSSAGAQVGSLQSQLKDMLGTAVEKITGKENPTLGDVTIWR